jgi:hypothetical protein
MDRFEALAQVGRLTLGRTDNGEWELFILHHGNSETVTFRGPNVAAVVARAVTELEAVGWLPLPAPPRRGDS